MSTHGGSARMLSKAASVKKIAPSIRAATEQSTKTREKIRDRTATHKATTIGQTGNNQPGMHLVPMRGDGANDFDVRGLHRGKWTASSPLDTEMQARTQLLQAGNPQTGATPWGMMHIDGKTAVEFAAEKKDQSQYLKALQMAEYLIDPKRPETQDHAYAVFPELLTRPQQQHLEEVAIHEALRNMMHHGRVDGREDHEMVMRIMHPDFRLTTFPAWDTEGQVIHPIADHGSRANALAAGIFSPRQWGWNQQNLQAAMKKRILKRLYPGLRDATDGQLNDVMASMFAEDLSSQVVATSQDVTQPGRAIGL